MNDFIVCDPCAGVDNLKNAVQPQWKYKSTELSITEICKRENHRLTYFKKTDAGCFLWKIGTLKYVPA